ncbi:MAG TPA: hypothetical protein VIE67_10755 [Rudaea sp.]|jgi:hypothetical protein|uniref:hypothetical protein n=1 Tax=Rudaea sp. TaxID=2136325 RepID=UPI002F94BE67
MSDPNISNDLGARELIALPDALRALPVAAPSASAWPALAASLAAQRSRDSGLGARDSAPRRIRRYALPAALAAAVALAFATTVLLRAPGPRGNSSDALATKSVASASSVHNATNEANGTNASTQTTLQTESFAALQARSHTLERWLHDTGKDSAPQSAQDLAAGAEIEDMIGLIDVQLSTSDASEETASLPLWRRRVALLEDLSTLRYGANLRQFKSGMFASEAAGDGRNASATWNN